MKKAAWILICAVLIVTAFAGCRNTADPNDNTTDGTIGGGTNDDSLMDDMEDMLPDITDKPNNNNGNGNGNGGMFGTDDPNHNGNTDNPGNNNGTTGNGSGGAIDGNGSQNGAVSPSPSASPSGNSAKNAKR